MCISSQHPSAPTNAAFLLVTAHGLRAAIQSQPLPCAIDPILSCLPKHIILVISPPSLSWFPYKHTHTHKHTHTNTKIIYVNKKRCFYSTHHFLRSVFGMDAVCSPPHSCISAITSSVHTSPTSHVSTCSWGLAFSCFSFAPHAPIANISASKLTLPGTAFNYWLTGVGI